MASLMFPDSGSRLVLYKSGAAAINARGYLYADETLTEPAEAYRDDDGAPGDRIAEDEDGRVSVRLDAYGRQPDFWGPEDGTDRLWMVVGGVASIVDADYNARTDDLEGRVSDVESGGASDALVVHKAGAETVTGAKTFSASPTVPAPSSGGHAATKTYVDAADSTEATARAAADTSEATTRAAADTTEATARAAADTTEATARAAAVTAEATTRAAADALLLHAINATDPTYGLSTGGGAAANSTALAAAQSAAVAAGKPMYVPPGTYNHNGFSFTTSAVGSPLGKTILHGPQITASTSGVMLADLKIVSSSSTAVISAHCSNVRWERVEVSHDVGVTNHLAWDAFDVDRMKVRDCTFGIGGLQLSGCDDFDIDGNYWDAQYLNTNEPCHISGQSSGQFVNNTVKNTATDAVDLYSSGHRCVVSNNRFIGLQGGAGLECKVTWTDDPNNSASVGNKFETTVISGNVFYDFNCDTTSTRTGIFAVYIDSRAVKAFSVAETNAAIEIRGNVLDGFNTTDPGNGAIVSYQGISYCGHNGIVSDNIIRNVRAWNGAGPVGILLSGDANGVIDGQKCVRTAIRGNTIVGVEGTIGTGIRSGSLDYCQIVDNIIGTDEESGVTTKLGIDFAVGATVNQCLIDRNVLQCNNAFGFGIRAAGTTITLTECTISRNVLRDCGMQVYKAVRCGFTDNVLSNAANGAGFTLGNTGTTCLDVRLIGNHITQGGSSSGIVMTNVDGFIADGNTFKTITRPMFAFGTTKNGIVTNTISRTQGVGSAVLIFDGTVSGPDQATTYIDADTNKILT